MKWIDGPVRPQHGRPAWVLSVHGGIVIAEWDDSRLGWHALPSHLGLLTQDAVAAYRYIERPPAPQAAVLTVGPGAAATSHQWVEPDRNNADRRTAQ